MSEALSQAEDGDAARNSLAQARALLHRMRDDRISRHAVERREVSFPLEELVLALEHFQMLDEARRSELDALRIREQRVRAEREQLAQALAQRTGELAESSRVANTLISTVGHELRTALAAISGYAELLQLGARGPLTPPQAEGVERILRSCSHLTSTIENLLSFGAITGGGIALSIRELAVTDILNGIEVFVDPQLSARSLTLRRDDGDHSATVVADGDRVRQIVLNLLTNAIKFSQPGRTVRLGWRVDESEVAITVQDEGRGIAAEHLESIFEPFVRVRDGRQSVPGTGLGLTICRDLARAMGGRIGVESVPGDGSVFTLYLARKIPQEKLPSG